MANDHDVNIDIVASDDASDVLDDVATKADDLEQAAPTVTVDADAGPALRSLEDVQAEAETLGHMTPKLVAEANLAEFHREVAKAIDQVQELDGQDVDVDTSKARRHLHDLGDAGDDAQKHVAKLGGEQSVQAISDLTGPLGDVSGAVSDVGQSFTGAASVIGSSMHLSEEAVEGLGNLLGPAGIVAGAVLYFWQTWKKKAEEAKKATAETVKDLEDLGVAATAQKKLQDALHADPKFAKAAADLHVSLADMTAFVEGKTVPALLQAQDVVTRYYEILALRRGPESFIDAAQRILGVTHDQAKALQDLFPAAKKVTDETDKQAGSLTTARKQYSDLQAVIKGQFNPTIEDTTGKLQGANVEVGKLAAKHHGEVVVSTNDAEVDATRRKVDALDGHTVTVNINANAANALAAFRNVFGLAGGGGSASRGASTVADIRAYERVNGRSWRTP